MAEVAEAGAETHNSSGDSRVLVDRDYESGIATITLNNPDRRNSYDAQMRNRVGHHLEEFASDDAIKVVLLRGEGGSFSAGADMNHAYSWYNGSSEATDTKNRRPSQRRRLAVDRKSFSFYHDLMGYPKVTVAEVRGCALGGGFEIALMADIAVVGDNALLGMPATRFLGPALGSLQLFFYRLGPVLARRMLLTGDTVKAGNLPGCESIFTEVVGDAEVSDRAQWWARKVSRMPADGIVIAKEAFRLLEQLNAYAGEEVISPLIHSFATNLQFDDSDFNFVKTRQEQGTKNAFDLSRAHFDPNVAKNPSAGS